MGYTTLLIDLDETLYDPAAGVWEAISQRMDLYMCERLNMPAETVRPLRTELYQTYGTTLRGLKVTRGVDERDFIDFVHDVPVNDLLQPDPGLREMLLRYPQRRIIFTNADFKHANRVVSRLGLEGCFERTVDIYDIAPYCKPMPEAYLSVLRIAGIGSAEECVFVDDSPRNLTAARALGFYTIQVGSPKPGFKHPPASAHAQIARLIDLPSVLDLAAAV